MKSCFLISFFAVLLNGCSLSSSSDQADIAWPAHLSKACEKIASSYPLSMSGEQELSIHDFNQYFSIDGQVSLYESEVTNHELLAKNVTDHLTLVNTVRNAFYSGSSSKPLLKLMIKTSRAPVRFQRLQLFFGERSGPGIQGPRFEFSYIWPNEDEPLKIKGIPLNGVNPLQEEFDGDWSLFKFFDKAQIQEADNGKVIAKFPVNEMGNFEFLLEGYFDWRDIGEVFSCP